MRITASIYLRLTALVAAIVVLLADPFGEMLVEWRVCADVGSLCARGLSVLAILGAITLMAIIADGILSAWLKLKKWNQRVRSAGIAIEPYLSERGEEREVGLVVYNNEKKLEMMRFEVWQSTFNSDDIDEQKLQDIRQQLGTFKSKRYSWRVGDPDRDGMVRIEPNGGHRELIIARTKNRGNTFALAFNDRDLTGIPPGTYRIGLGAKGRMLHRRAGLYSFAVEIKYRDGGNIAIREISLEEANIRIVG